MMSNQLNLIYQSPVSAIIKNPSTLHRGLLFLWRLAWKSRLRLSYLLIIAFMIFDVRMTFEVIVDVGPDDNSDDDSGSDDDDDSNDSSIGDSGALLASDQSQQGGGSTVGIVQSQNV